MSDTPEEALLRALIGSDPDSIGETVRTMPEGSILSLLALLGAGGEREVPPAPLQQAQQLDENFLGRNHLAYLSARLARAVQDVEDGQDRRIVVSMPPRYGKSTLGSTFFPTWVLRRHPDWKILLVSHSPSLAASWGRQIRRLVEDHGAELGVQIAPDAKAVTEWETTRKGVVMSRSVGQALAGVGAKVLLVDDPTRDFKAAHSESAREGLWEWWRADALTRLEPPSLVVVTATRWHEDDLIGKILADAPDPDTWEVISFPAIAEEHDALGRIPGEPLLSPVVRDDTPEKALARFAEQERSLGSYAWSALFQQRPAPAKGAIFNTDWWRYWTLDPERADGDRLILLDLVAVARGTLLTSWDAAFKGTESSDYVVGQRWARVGADRFLLDQSRARRSFTDTLKEIKRFATDGLGAAHTHRHLVEDNANGPAIIDVLRSEISGIKPVNPEGSKEARARAVTPEIESGNVYLPDPSMPGYEWVNDLIAEARLFPTGKHDDQVDSLTQALNELRGAKPAALLPPTSGGGAGRMMRTPGSFRSVRRTR